MFPNPHFNESKQKSMKYDERSSIFQNVADNYGVGKAQPVGHKEGAKENVPCAPKKSFVKDGIKL